MEEETEQPVEDPKDVVEAWFRETFYNRALDTETFNYIQEAKNDLISRFN